MLNQCILVGKIAETPVAKTTSNGNPCATLLVEVDRPFRNASGKVEQDIFKVFLWKGLADEVANTAKVGSIVGIKGRLQSNNYTDKKEVTYYNADVVAEKVSYLSTEKAH